MSKTFVKSQDLKLENGGYLMVNGQPVYNQQFVDAQKHAEYLVTFANVAKGRNFKPCNVDSFEGVARETEQLLSKSNVVTFVKNNEVTHKPVTNALLQEALSFITEQTQSQDNAKINEFLQQFTILRDFEEFGLFFEEGIVKLNRIYTVEEIVEAVKSCTILVQ